MKKMLLAIESLGTGGAEKALVNFVKHYSSEYEIYILVYTKSNNFYARDLESLANVQYVLTLSRMRLAKLARILSPKLLYALTVKRLFKGVYFDIEIAYLEGIATKIIAGSDLNSKKVAWVHCDFMTNHWCLNYYSGYQEEYNCYLKYNSIFLVTNEQKKAFSQYWKIEDNLCVIPNLLDVNGIISSSLENIESLHTPYICAIGGLKAIKGFDRLIDAFFEFSKTNDDCNLYILGRGVLEAELSDRITRHSLNNRIFLLGHQENPYKYIRNSIGLIQSSISESFGYVLLEAGILGRNVVATKTVGSIEVQSIYFPKLRLIGHTREELVMGLNYLYDHQSEPATNFYFDNKFITNLIDKELSKYEK